MSDTPRREILMRSEAPPVWRKPDSIMAQEARIDNNGDKVIETGLRKVA